MSDDMFLPRLGHPKIIRRVTKSRDEAIPASPDASSAILTLTAKIEQAKRALRDPLLLTHDERQMVYRLVSRWTSDRDCLIYLNRHGSRLRQEHDL